MVDVKMEFKHARFKHSFESIYNYSKYLESNWNLNRNSQIFFSLHFKLQLHPCSPSMYLLYPILLLSSVPINAGSINKSILRRKEYLTCSAFSWLTKYLVVTLEGSLFWWLGNNPSAKISQSLQSEEKNRLEELKLIAYNKWRAMRYKESIF